MNEAKAKQYARGDFRQYMDPAEDLLKAMNSDWDANHFYRYVNEIWGDPADAAKAQSFEQTYENRDDLCENCHHFKPAKGNEYWDGVGVCAIPPSSHRNLRLTDRYNNPVRPIMQFRGAGVFVTVTMYRCDGFKRTKEA